MGILIRKQGPNPNYDTQEFSFETGCSCPEASLAQQSSKDEADINVLLRRFGVTGQLPQVVRAPTYGDFTGIFDFQTAQNVIKSAEDSFMAMPADVRTRFNNDPALFVAFCSDEANLPEMRKLGLAIPEKVVSNTPAADGPPKE